MRAARFDDCAARIVGDGFHAVPFFFKIFKNLFKKLLTGKNLCVIIKFLVVYLGKVCFSVREIFEEVIA